MDQTVLRSLHEKEPALSLPSSTPSPSRQHVPESTLYVIGTPIGNLSDITLRALHILEMADIVACEDTRVTQTLLEAYGLSKELVSAHQHNEREAADKLIAFLRQGKRVALVSDAGTPAVSDPGAKIVDAIRKAGLNVVPVPGPSAAITAFSASGLLSEHFLFIGFLPVKSEKCRTLLQTLKDVRSALIIYEAPHRIEETLSRLADVFEPTRQIVIARELTKLFEEIHRCPLSEATEWINANPNRSKGEFVLLIEGAAHQKEEADQETRRILSILLDEMPVSAAAAAAAKITGHRKNKLYEMALQLKNASDD